MLCAAEHYADICSVSVFDAGTSYDQHPPSRFEQAMLRLRLAHEQDELRNDAEDLAKRLRC